MGCAPHDRSALHRQIAQRLKQPAKPPEPAPQDNPLSEWYADLEFRHRKPLVLLLNAGTGALLVLQGDAAGLRRLHEHALQQFAAVCERVDLRGAGVDAELHGFDAEFAFAATRDRSLLGTLNQRKYEVPLMLEYDGSSLFDVALRDWTGGLFAHPALGKSPGLGGRWHRPLDLQRQRLPPP